MAEPPHYPSYDVLAKRATPSWDEVTRRAVDRRLAVADEPHFFDGAQWAALGALCEAVMPQTGERPLVPLAAHVDRKCGDDGRDGYRDVRLPPLREAWLRGLAALEAEARARHGTPFAGLGPERRDALVAAMQRGDCYDPVWGSMPPAVFFTERVVHDIVRAYYAHPSAWSEIGFGGPASPRGYVRLGLDERDPWEAAAS